ncbi:MAG: hypothetical protein HY052_02565 [Proteobacteria bacterium]|nr:hypothetical protein [Pseudomonadota bacterium]
MKSVWIFVSFLLLAVVQRADAYSVACLEVVTSCPDGSPVSHTGPTAACGSCPAKNTGAAGGAEAALVRCEQDTDCIVVPYNHCCGLKKRAINKAALSSYKAHPEWQKFDEPICASMGICFSDEKVTQAHCRRSPDKTTGVCELNFN